MGLSDLTQDSANATVTNKSVPGPKGTVLWGSLKEFQADAIGFLDESVQRYGDIVRFRFGPVVAYLVNHPEYVEHVLVRESRRYDKNTRSVSKLRATCGDSLLSSDGDPWLRHRRLIQPAFQPRRVAEFSPTIDASTDEMLRSWEANASIGQEIDIVSEMMGLTLAIAARAFFASDIREQTAVIEQALEVILQDTWRRLETPFDFAAISPIFHRSGFRRAIQEIDEVVYRMIAQRRECNFSPDDLLSRLLHAHETDDGTGFNDKELRDAVVTLLLAGHETTANALVNAFYLISQSTETQDRLACEANQHALNAEPGELPETQRAFMEAIRLYPSIWIIERHAVEADQIGGYSIPKGATVILSPYLLHRHQEFWRTPQAFDPDRFTPDKISMRSRYAYLPFGLGPHRCIGEHMAMLVATRILARVHRHFRLRLVAGQSFNPVPGITLRHASPVRMMLERIDQGGLAIHPPKQKK
ncbi:MAG: cytochrome P450 [Rubripirellula sp.]|nr:cytochrome P450 [Rubripirellula sp.]